jgi:DNA-directed RNA polymerase subunit RPC12/RpoP
MELSSPRIHCPNCGSVVAIRSACSIGRLSQAIQLQTIRFGVEANCEHCQERFLYSRVPPVRKTLAGTTHADD